MLFSAVTPRSSGGGRRPDVRVPGLPNPRRTAGRRDYPYDYPEPEADPDVAPLRLRAREVPVPMVSAAGAELDRAARTAYYMVKVLLAVVVWLFRSRPVFVD